MVPNTLSLLVSRLKQTWSELRDSVLQVYQDSMADSKDSLDKPDVTCLKGKGTIHIFRKHLYTTIFNLTK